MLKAYLGNYGKVSFGHQFICPVLWTLMLKIHGARNPMHVDTRMLESPQDCV